MSSAGEWTVKERGTLNAFAGETVELANKSAGSVFEQCGQQTGGVFCDVKSGLFAFRPLMVVAAAPFAATAVFDGFHSDVTALSLARCSSSSLELSAAGRFNLLIGAETCFSCLI